MHNAIDKERMKRYWPGIKKAINYIMLTGLIRSKTDGKKRKVIRLLHWQRKLQHCLLRQILQNKIMNMHWQHIAAKQQITGMIILNDWTYVTNTQLAKKYNVEGYYIRINPYLILLLMI